RAVEGGLIAVVNTDGASRLARIDLQAEGLGIDEIDFLSDATTVVSGFDADDETLVLTGSTPSSPAVLGRLDLKTDDAPLMLRQHPAPANSVVPEVLRVPGDGGTITGWLAKPRGQGPYPVIVNVHGGPFSQYTHSWIDETQALPAAGFGLVHANPRVRRTHPQLGDRGAGRYGGTGHGRCAGCARPRTRERPRPRRRPPRRPGRLLRRLSHGHDDRRR